MGMFPPKCFCSQLTGGSCHLLGERWSDPNSSQDAACLCPSQSETPVTSQPR